MELSIDELKKIYDIAKDKGCEEVSFEYVIGSLFPKVRDNIMTEIHQQYTQGYLDGLNDKKKAK